MGIKGLKYMNKVDLEKDAATEPFLHVRSLGNRLTLHETAADNTQNRWHPDSTNCPSKLYLSS